MNIGDYFRVVQKSHFAHGQTHRCAGLPNIKVKGEPVLDLGCLVEFVIEDYYGKPCSHVVPIEWCLPVERPSVKKRVKAQRYCPECWSSAKYHAAGCPKGNVLNEAFDEGAKKEFWDDMYAACRSKR